MKKVTMYIGLNDKDSRKQEISTEAARDLIADYLKPLGGATISDALGVYTYASGETEKENTQRVEMFEPDIELLKSIVPHIKKALNQESIAVNIEEVNSMFL